MKITLEFTSYSEMMTFCRERIAQAGLAAPLTHSTASPSDGEEGTDSTERAVSLGKRQLAVLAVLSNGEAQGTKEIADTVGISVPALSATLKSLAKRGMVRKVRWGVWASEYNGTLVAPAVSLTPEPVVEDPPAPKKAKKAKKAPRESTPDTPDTPVEVEPAPPKGKGKSSVEQILADL